MTTMCVSAANYIIELTNVYNEGKSYSTQISMTCKRLQKLLYFSDIKYMKDNNGNSMFKDSFYAWPSGPVIPSVYDKFIQYQDGKMEPLDGNHSPLTTQMKEAIDFVFKNTIDIDTLDLVQISHVQDGPWHCAYDPNDEKHEQVIQKSSMFTFYQAKENFLSLV